MIDVGRDFERMREYLVGRMSDEERRTFEDRLVRDPELVRELEQSLQLREGLLQLRTQGYLERLAAGTRRGSLERPRERRLLRWVPALAAAAIAAVALFLWVQPRATSPGILQASPETSAAGAVAALFTFVATRARSAPDLALPPRGLIELRAQPASHATVARFRLTLLREEEGVPAASLGTLTGLALDTEGYVHGYVNVARLTPGSYRLRVEPAADAGGAADSFAFRLRAVGWGHAP